MNDDINKPVVHIPDGAKINIDSKQMDEPTVQYEKRKVKFCFKKIKHIVGGRYGREFYDTKNT
jgi:hypothetical protein